MLADTAQHCTTGSHSLRAVRALAQKIDKELKTALDALEKEKAAALKDLDSQVCPLCLPQLLAMLCDSDRQSVASPMCRQQNPGAEHCDMHAHLDVGTPPT